MEKKEKSEVGIWGAMSLSASIYMRPGGSSFPTIDLPSADPKTKEKPFNDAARSSYDEKTARSIAGIVGIKF